MSFGHTMKEIIRTLLANILTEDWTARTQSLAELMTITDPTSVSAFNEVLDKKSDLQCIYFCQFLGKTLFATGIDYLIPFLSDERERVQQEAMWAFDRYVESEKIEEKKKTLFLIEALQSSGERGRTYAAESFGKYAKREGVPYLIDTLKDASPKVRLACIESLRQIGDLNAVPYIAPHLTDSHFHVRYAACFALGEFRAKTFFRHIIPLLKDEKMSVRQAAVWALARLKPATSIKYIVHSLKNDPAPLVRIEAAKRLGKIQKSSVVNPLFFAYAEDLDQNVRGTASYALDNLESSIKLKTLIKNLETKDLKIKVSDLQKIALTKTPTAFKIIYKTYKKNPKEPQIQAACCECFGLLEKKEAVPILKEALHGHPVVAYSALRSLALILGDSEKAMIIALLSDEKLGEVQKQIVLQFMLKKVTDGRLYLDVPLSELLKKLILSSNVNISYSAIRILAESFDISAVIPILETSQKTKDQEHKKKCLNSIDTLLHGDPSSLLKLLHQSLAPQLKKAIFECLKIFNVPEKLKLKAVLGTLHYYVSCNQEDRIPMMGFIASTVKNSPHVILQILYQTKWPDDIVEDLLFILDDNVEAGNRHNILLNIKPLEKIIYTSHAKQRIAAIRLLEKIGQVEAVSDLTKLFFDEKDESVKKYTRAAIRTIVHGRKA